MGFGFGKGFRTLFVDADLRKPSVSKLFFGENRKPGLSEILLGKSSVADAIQRCDVENLSIITAGGRSENPSELLSGPKVGKFFEEIRKDFDRIVVDSAPVVAVSDTLLLLTHADVNTLIVWANSTPKKSILHALRLPGESGYPAVGIVLNRLRSGRSGAYYAYAYSGRNYGGYGSKGVYDQ